MYVRVYMCACVSVFMCVFIWVHLRTYILFSYPSDCHAATEVRSARLLEAAVGLRGGYPLRRATQPATRR